MARTLKLRLSNAAKQGRSTSSYLRKDHFSGGRPTNDATAIWPEENRKTVKLGMIAIPSAEPNATCDAQTIDPVGGLPVGFAGPANDPMFAICSPTYATSLSRRTP